MGGCSGAEALDHHRALIAALEAGALAQERIERTEKAGSSTPIPLPSEGESPVGMTDF
jgi:hypothetical protein